jgi:hypothetical protein
MKHSRSEENEAKSETFLSASSPWFNQQASRPTSKQLNDLQLRLGIT